MASTALVWFRRDLRVHDHPPLRAALDARGIEHLDTMDALAAEARSAGADALFESSHFSPLGNDVVARALASRLESAF